MKNLILTTLFLSACGQTPIEAAKEYVRDPSDDSGPCWSDALSCSILSETIQGGTYIQCINPSTTQPYVNTAPEPYIETIAQANQTTIFTVNRLEEFYNTEQWLWFHQDWAWGQNANTHVTKQATQDDTQLIVSTDWVLGSLTYGPATYIKVLGNLTAQQVLSCK